MKVKTKRIEALKMLLSSKELGSQEEVLNELKKEGYRTFGLTNWSAETLPRVIDQYEFFKLFEGIVVSGEEHLVKPDPRIFKVLLNRYNLKADECLFIDDSAKNIQAAQLLGMATKHLTE